MGDGSVRRGLPERESAQRIDRAPHVTPAGSLTGLVEFTPFRRLDQLEILTSWKI